MLFINKNSYDVPLGKMIIFQSITMNILEPDRSIVVFDADATVSSGLLVGSKQKGVVGEEEVYSGLVLLFA